MKLFLILVAQIISMTTSFSLSPRLPSTQTSTSRTLLVSKSAGTELSTSAMPAAFIDDAGSNEVHHALSRKKWGIDNKYENEYWFDARIHTLGNSGLGGGVHAACAMLATYIIDKTAYHGVDIRAQVASELAKIVNKSKAKVLDLCCGVGVSTRALRQAFPDAEAVIGLDTSPEMVAMASFLTSHLSAVEPFVNILQNKLSLTYTVLKEQSNRLTRAAGAWKSATFARGNAENTHLPSQSFDLVTIMYAFHEAPKAGRDKILQEARRLLQPEGTLAIVDISTDYKPSKSMLSGEPYVLEYQRNIHDQLKSFEGFRVHEYKLLVPGHVGMWLMKRCPA